MVIRGPKRIFLNHPPLLENNEIANRGSFIIRLKRQNGENRRINMVISHAIQNIILGEVVLIGIISPAPGNNIERRMIRFRIKITILKLRKNRELGVHLIPIKIQVLLNFS